LNDADRGLFVGSISEVVAAETESGDFGVGAAEIA
jgi:hypothetical protein